MAVAVGMGAVAVGQVVMVVGGVDLVMIVGGEVRLGWWSSGGYRQG
jgi:hypothetical protein